MKLGTQSPINMPNRSAWALSFPRFENQVKIETTIEMNPATNEASDNNLKVDFLRPVLVSILRMLFSQQLLP
jgi:hypothetical protein